MYFNSNIKEECCGCTACKNVCPVSAIDMQEDIEGFKYPTINQDLCINCKLCEKVCPFEHIQKNDDRRAIVLAAMLKDEQQRQRSTSGGAFYAIAENVIKNGGKVYGAAFNEQLILNHIGVETLSDLELLRGSKYLQSDLKDIFKDVKENLNKGRICYFVGTGCQIAGLKAFLRKDYSNLITSDIVCHGVPSQKLFNYHLSYLGKRYHSSVVNYQFRDNKAWGVCEIATLKNGKIKKLPSYNLSPYLYSFMYGMTYRHSCYNCHYAKVPRIGDITLADFWGVEHCDFAIDVTHGVSLIMLNTLKGIKFWDSIKETLEYHESDILKASSYNKNVVQPSNKPETRDEIYQIIEAKGYEYVVKKYFRHPKFHYLKLRSYLVPLKKMTKKLFS